MGHFHLFPYSGQRFCKTFGFSGLGWVEMVNTLKYFQLEVGKEICHQIGFAPLDGI
jgi:hypothetical protein